MPANTNKRKSEEAVSARPPKIRHGAKKHGKRQLHEEPGDPESCDTFLQCKGNEQKTAAYLGFYHTKDLRLFAISWPVLKAYIHGHNIMSGKNQEIPRRQVLEVIKGDEARISKADPAKDWNLNDKSETEERRKLMKTRHLAYHLLILEADVEKYQTNSFQRNKDLDAQYRTQFNELSKARVPYEKFKLRKPPGLVRYPGKESRLESINRCYTLLQYLKHSLDYAHIWNGKMDSLESIRNGVHVSISHVPGWMQVEEDETGVPFPPDDVSDDVSDDDTDYKPISVKVVWYQDKMLPGHEDLEAAISNGKSCDFKIPPSDQSLSKNPRLYKSGDVFRDMIRKMFNCQELRLNIRDLELRYTSAAHGFGVSKDLLSGEWEECKAVFASDENSNFVIKLVLYAVEDPSADILENYNLQPELEMMVNDDENAGEASQAGPEKANASSICGIFGLRGFAGHYGIGRAPKPRNFSERERSLEYYGGFDVTSESGRRGWQKSMLHDVARTVPPNCVKRDKPPRDFTSSEKAAVTEAEYQAERLRAEDQSEPKTKKDVEYYTQQKAFSGTENRVGPFVNLCLDLLLCEPDGDRYRATLFQAFTHNITFYHYQISGAVGLILKQYGEIDATKIIASAGLDSNDRRAEKVKHAAKQLTDLRTHCVILADETGFGKTITWLLMLLMRTMLTEIMKPTLLVVPATVIGQWLTEIRGHWPCFRPVLSYNDSEWEDALGLDSIPAQAMRDPEHNLPPSLKWLFDEDNPETSKAIVVTTYNTHLCRSLCREKSDYIDEGTTCKPQSAEKKRFQTRCEGKFGLLIADEAQRFKNQASATWAMLFAHRFEKAVAVTATPMFNSIKDILGFIEQFWQLVKPELEFRKTQNDWREDELLQEKQPLKIQMQRFAGLERLDPRRLKLLKPELIRRVLESKRDKHKRVAEYVGLLFDLVMIQRGHASVLPQESGEGISFKDMVPKSEWSTAEVKLLSHEVQEYQVFHRLAASLYTSEFIRRSRTNSILALRQFSIIGFSIIGARLNRLMEATGRNTYVRQLAHWRMQFRAGEFIHKMTRRKGDIGRIKFARDLIKHLAYGSPAIRLVCKQILEIRAVEALQKHSRRYQRLLIGESHPFNAWFLEAFLREMLIDARVFHSGLDNSERAKLVKEFNDPESSIQCLIMTYNVGAIGLNLHEACKRVVITSIGINRAQESQLAGRIRSKFPATVVRRMTLNSHDQFRSARQIEKASLQLAVNAKCPDISNLMVKLLNELQPDVDHCHASQEGRKLFTEAQGSGRQTGGKQPPMNQAPEEPIHAHEEMQTEVQTEEGTRITDRPTEEVAGPEEFDNFDNVLNRVKEDDTSEEADSNYDTEDDYEGCEFSDADLDSEIGEPGTSETDEIRPYKACRRFAEIRQPSEEEGYRLALLALPPRKIWTVQDLEKEHFLHMGLRLLYNRIHGIKRLSLGKNIHINYDNLPKLLLNQISKTLTERERKRIQHLLTK
ncbi:hypothetical protein N7474_001538 [Penicillium riverlandense]|uniref:uncharacterized protein n=1 Tax=Penicillium riverlandense TaxID=1903569 RepID=UPI00254889BE|nr:uncharacterized protein N7474_001538 [Penicillium riverlandense]KAJ5833227.1 hypothetical protein N7474_001538 [Penicillium riverlandense]